MSRQRQLSPLDRLVMQADRMLRGMVSDTAAITATTRPSPATTQHATTLASDAAQHAAGLMRINHTGEICAQALYAGQALTAKLPGVRAAMDNAAREEEDHLAWCAERLRELHSGPSLLDPLFYGLSFAVGAAAGMAGDKWSLGFVEETERQVVRHLDDHLRQLPADDGRSRAIVEQMRTDEQQHADTAHVAGAAPLPFPVRRLMQAMAAAMKMAVYRI